MTPLSLTLYTSVTFGLAGLAFWGGYSLYRRKSQNYGGNIERIIDVMPDIILLIDKDYNVKNANKKALEALGLKANQLIGKKCYQVIHKTGAPVENCPCYLSKLDKRSHETEIFDPVLKKYLAATSLPIFDLNDEVSSSIHIIKDITERKELDNRMSQFRKMEALGRLAGGLAHEFNNLLSIISSAFYMLKNQQPGKKDDENTATIQKAISDASTLTRHLLTLSQRQLLDLKPTDINAIISETVQITHKLLGENTRIETEFGMNLHHIHGDPSQINKLLMHILVQAETQSGQKREILIRTENVTMSDFHRARGEAAPRNFIRISLKDNAYKVKKESIGNIFEPYFESKRMNLAIAYSIARQHNGWIDVTSKNDVAVFEIYLPESISAPETKAHRPEATAETPRPSPASPLRILLAEDDEDLRVLAARTLKINGHTVTEAESAEHALEIFDREKGAFDALVSDVVMPDKSGVDLADAILKVKPDIKVILMSGYIDDKIHMDTIQQKGYKFIYKPFDVDALLTMLKF